MSALHPAATPIRAGEIRIIRYPDRVPPMISVHPGPEGAFLEFDCPADGRELAAKINRAMDLLEEEIIAAAGEPAEEALEDDGATGDGDEPEAGCSE